MIEEIEKIIENIRENEVQIKKIENQVRMTKDALKSNQFAGLEKMVAETEGEVIGMLEDFTHYSIPYSIQIVNPDQIQNFVLQVQLQGIPDEEREFVERLYRSLRKGIVELKTLIATDLTKFCVYFQDGLKPAQSLETVEVAFQNKIILSGLIEWLAYLRFNQWGRDQKAYRNASSYYRGALKNAIAGGWIHLLMEKPLASWYQYSQQRNKLKEKVLKRIVFWEGEMVLLQKSELLNKFFKISQLIPLKAEAYRKFVKSGVMKLEPQTLEAIWHDENEIKKLMPEEDWEDLTQVWKAETVCHSLNEGAIDFVTEQVLGRDKSHMIFLLAEEEAGKGMAPDLITDRDRQMGRKFISALTDRLGSFERVYNLLSRKLPSLDELLEPEIYLL